jgi:hypothetical protein
LPATAATKRLDFCGKGRRLYGKGLAGRHGTPCAASPGQATCVMASTVLPDELWRCILAYCDYVETASLACVCRQTARLAQAPPVWHSLCVRHSIVVVHVDRPDWRHHFRTRCVARWKLRKGVKPHAGLASGQYACVVSGRWHINARFCDCRVLFRCVLQRNCTCGQT